MLSSVLAVAATTGGVVLGLAPIAQVRLIHKRRSSEGVSTSYWLVLTAAMLLWLAYGISIANPAMVIANGVSVSMAVVMVVVGHYYSPARTARRHSHHR